MTQKANTKPIEINPATTLDRFRLGDLEVSIVERITRPNPAHPHHCEFVASLSRTCNAPDGAYTLEELLLLEELIKRAKDWLWDNTDWPC